MNLKSYLRGAGIGMVTAALVLMVSTGNTSHAMTDDEVRARAKELGMTDGSEVLLASASAPSDAVTSDDGTTIEVANPADGELQESDDPSMEEVPDLVIRGGEVAEGTEAASETVSSEAADTDTPPEDTDTADTSGEVNTEDTADTQETDAAGKALEGQQTTDITSDVTGEDKNKSELLADAAETENETESQPVKTDSGFVSITVSGGMSSTAVARALQSAGAVDSAAEFDSYLCRNGYDRKLSTGEFRIPAGSSEEDIAQILMKKK